MEQKQLADLMKNVLALSSNEAVMDALHGTEQVETLDAVYSLLSQVKQQVGQGNDIADGQPTLYDTHSRKSTPDLVEIADAYQSELEDNGVPAHEVQVLIDSAVDALVNATRTQKQFESTHADVLSQYDTAKKAVRTAKTRVYAVTAKAVQTGAIHFTEKNVNDAGDELDSYKLPDWLDEAVGFQNAQSLSYDENELMFFVRAMNLWDVVSLDTQKLERFVKADADDRDGSQTKKYALPIPLPVTISPQVKITVSTKTINSRIEPSEVIDPDAPAQRDAMNKLKADLHDTA